MNPSDVEREILSESVEDYQGLWEIIAWLKHFSPTSSAAHTRNMAEPSLRKLLQKGWVKLYRRAEAFGPEVTIASDELENVILEQANWE